MKRFQILVIVTLALLPLGCSGFGGVQGSGNVISENRSVSGFSSVTLAGNGQIVVDQNGTESLTISAEDNILPLITTEVHGSQLVLKFKDGTSINNSKDIVYKLSAKNLTGISIVGSGSADAKDVHTDALKVDITGSGEVTVAGASDRLDISISGSGDYKGPELKSKAATVNIAGSGNVELAASDTLDATIAGAGAIKYVGDPKVTQHVMGSGSIDRE